MPELDDATLERRLGGVLKEHLGALPFDLTVEALDRRREAKGVARRLSRANGMTLLAAAALLLVGGAVAAGSGLVRLPSVLPPLPAPSVAVATTSPDATTTRPTPTTTLPPSMGPSPSDPIGPLAWTGASVKEDWPAAVRPEPAGGATVVQIRHRDLTPDAPSDESHDWQSDQYRDPLNDTSSDAHPWADIRRVEFCGETGLSIGRVSNPPAAVDPRQLWIAYGAVVDSDADGVPDWRYGVDNVPLDKTDSEPDRWWRTDLHTGRTNYAVGDHITLGDGEPGPVFWAGSGCEMSFGAETAGAGMVGGGLPERFYAWASVIVDGRVVATDYAPDAGWLDRSPDAKPLPKPGGPYVLQQTEEFPLEISMTLPEGWTEHGRPELTGDRGNMVVQFGVIDKLENPCSDTVEPPLASSFDALVADLEAMPNIDTSQMREVTIDGYRAVYLRSWSALGLFCTQDTPFPLDPAWIIDVDGVRIGIVATSVSAPTTETVRSEVRQIVESIQIVGASPPDPPPASPSPTTRPTPTQTPFVPSAGPAPPNARSWTVTVDNQSSEPATLFVAEEDGHGGLRLVGSATPNVVPARTTVKVTFLLPAKNDPDAGWIYVNPGPDSGGLFPSLDLPPAGKIVVTADGQVGWLSP